MDGETRQTYRHGDLRRVLLDAGIALARKNGPQAVVLREVTRRVGVAPNAAYRHFASRQALLEAVRAAALAAAACCMEDELAKLPAATDGSNAEVLARGALRAVGLGYLRFAYTEPGLFRTAFASADIGAADPAKAGRSGRNPFELLGDALDAMMAAGVLAPARRVGAHYLAWSAVHGLALLVMDGPLREMPAQQRDALGQRLLDMVEAGL